jgi:hypothetical protein
MQDIKLLALARDLRARAREMLSRAETIYDMDTEQRMRAGAACYDEFGATDRYMNPFVGVFTAARRGEC